MSLSRKSTFFPHNPVFIITGSLGGLGKELAAILYQRNAKVYLAAQSEKKTAEVIKEIRKAHPKSSGELLFHPLQLNDLATIKSSAEQFLTRESRLDGSTTVQGCELQLGINSLGYFLFTHFLHPLLIASSAADTAPIPAIDFSNIDYYHDAGIWSKYSRSKAGNVLYAVKYARRARSKGIINIKLISHPPINGAYAEHFAGLHPSITEENNGGWVAPFGKLEPVRMDLLDISLCWKYWKWCETQVTPYI
ncbi:short-chain dehydrogenase [Aspergillus flavus]|uniref:Short-chain dehydrogenase n=1 Tax=Aspergillus flavus (strain ATCC 200026 / FGSC A1120 / IAM 13836 / NRRL 3357 / JCM 12722 / SRRC 167) TaxID=332952 RepID=A0A7U2MWF2_ASPFN|nr:short-chain dehydrogenase [Aspergillus flavus]